MMHAIAVKYGDAKLIDLKSTSLIYRI